MVAPIFACTGACALSTVARKISRDKLAELQTVDGFAVRQVFFVRMNTHDSRQEARLRELLDAREDFLDENENDNVAASALIIPRPGVKSPWASKAGDILRHCGLDAVGHVERGVFMRRGDKYAAQVADRMVQTVLHSPNLKNWRRLFDSPQRKSAREVDLNSLTEINNDWGLSLSAEEIEHLQKLYTRLKQTPTEAELMMFAQANSEHCRHKIFRAAWTDGGESLMDLIRKTHAASPQGVITAFSDNAAVVRAAEGKDFAPDINGEYCDNGELLLVAKAETHNHPTAISPFAGAATGSGGEIRDEAAAGRGSTTRAGFAGFIVSRMALSDVEPPACHEPSSHLASPLEIMIDAPLGAANYCNEFGRPSLAGFFRAYENRLDKRNIGFHKPLMLAGGLGHIRTESTGKNPIPPGAKIIQLGGPGFRIGIGGGAASSRTADGDDDDFASVQRDNAEMQRRTQEVLDACRRLHDGKILSLHDVGAGGIANAVIEMVHDAKVGARIELARIPSEDPGMSAAEVWCNESQERYVLALDANAEDTFASVCARENCPYAVIGEATKEQQIVLVGQNDETVVNLPLAEVLDNIPHPPRVASPTKTETPADKTTPAQTCALGEMCEAVLSHPTTANKRFLITIGDRTVGGLTARDQMVGPWQTPVADCAAFFNDYNSFGGAAYALGERAGIAAQNPAAGARMAVAESLSNLAAAARGELREVKLSLNWLGNCADEVRVGELRAAVSAAADFCVELNVGVVVGKDSLFMRADSNNNATIESPAMPAATAFMPCEDARRILTPQLSAESDSFLMLAAPETKRRLGGSVFAEIYGDNDETPDIDAAAMSAFWRAVAECHARGLLSAYHDRSDGGLWAAACEMAFASNCGVTLVMDSLLPAAQTDGGERFVGGDKRGLETALFCEEIGALLEVSEKNAPQVLQIFADAGLSDNIQTAGRKNDSRRIRIYGGGRQLEDFDLDDLRRRWDATAYEICKRRDAPDCAEAEHQRDLSDNGGLFLRLPDSFPSPAPIVGGARPRIAILREQGGNGQREMAAAFTRAGFLAEDVTMNDLRGKQTLDEFVGVALCGGFSFGDVMGGGRGWAEGILQNPKLADMFESFFAKNDTFAFGACNGCQALALLQPLMPKSKEWQFPRFVSNASCRFEARFVMNEILSSPSPLFLDMAEACLPVASSHAEGRAIFDMNDSRTHSPAVLRFVDANGAPTLQYPDNPNGSAEGFCGFCSPDGRITVAMPHPERVFRRAQMSWAPPQWEHDDSPWLQMFVNARRFVQ